jgi:hypothetical protein
LGTVETTGFIRLFSGSRRGEVGSGWLGVGVGLMVG